MNRVKTRLLTTGASVFVIGMVLPGVAAAQTTIVPGEYQAEGQNFYEVDADEEIVSGTQQIVDTPGSPAAASARVECATGCANPGSIEQVAVDLTGPVSNHIEINGSRIIRADAQANGSPADANAEIDFGVRQSASGTEAVNELVNGGSLDIIANAQIIREGDAAGRAAIGTGVDQKAEATEGDASSQIVNSGAINVVAQADVVDTLPGTGAGEGTFAPGSVSAAASIGTGIRQEAIAAEGEAAVLFDNSGVVNIHSSAVGESNGPTALASIDAGIDQSAVSDSGSASARLSNEGELNILADAKAAGTFLTALAEATIDVGIGQSAASSSDTAAVSLINEGAITIGAQAYETASFGDVLAAIETGIRQEARGSSGEVSLINEGDISISAEGFGEPFTTSNVVATIGVGISQSAIATGAGSASASINNSGNIDILAAGGGHGTSTTTVEASIGVGVLQEASGVGNAEADLTNAGNINITADIVLPSYGSGTIRAVVQTGIQQLVSASGDNAHALAALANEGDISVLAAASITGAAFFGIGQFDASAGVTLGMLQQVSGVSSAEAALSNTGTLSIQAEVTAADGLADLAQALGYVGEGFVQIAEATGPDGSASADLANEGTLSIGVDAAAVAGEGTASAQALVGTIGTTIFGGVTIVPGVALGQVAAGDGSATAELVNSGSLLIGVSADALGLSGDAWAMMGVGVLQDASASEGNAEVTLENSDLLSIGLDAHSRVLLDGNAAATLTAGLWQNAYAEGFGTASASLDNSGAMTISVDANVEAGGLAEAYAELVAGIVQQVGAAEGASGSFSNTGDLIVAAAASAHLDNAADIAFTAFATALAGGFRQVVTARAAGTEQVSQDGKTINRVYDVPTGLAEATFSNSGTFVVEAVAEVLSDGFGAGRAVSRGMEQFADGIDAVASFDNSGTFNVLATVNLTALAGAPFNPSAPGDRVINGDVAAIGIRQAAAATGTETQIIMSSAGLNFEIFKGVLGPASASLSNSGSINVIAEGTFNGGHSDVWEEDSTAWAHVEVAGITQAVAGADSSAIFENDGEVTIGGSGHVSAEGAGLIGYRIFGIGQQVQGYATETSLLISPSGEIISDRSQGLVGSNEVSLTNSGTINIYGEAQATAERAGFEMPVYGIYQTAYGEEATATLDNSGSINIVADIDAEAAEAYATIYMLGLSQLAAGEKEATASFENSGSISVAATIDFAGGLGHQETLQTAIGVAQSAVGLSEDSLASLTFENSGSLTVLASSKAEGAPSSQMLPVFAVGVEQFAEGGTTERIFRNSGDIAVAAVAELATDDNAGENEEHDRYAQAIAVGYAGDRSTADPDDVVDSPDVGVDLANSGELAVSATVNGGTANATAFAGARAINLIAVGTAESEGAISGSIDNSGDIIVLAEVDAVQPEGTEPLVMASATGVYMSSGTNNATVTNSGAIEVIAVANEGSAASASGILAIDNGIAEANPGDLLTITNDGGSIIAAVSMDGGDTFERGNAIDVSLAPNRTLINLLGDGSIYGNIDIAAGDDIVVADGETSLDGIINAEFVGLDTDDASGPAFEGTLSIEGDGALYLRNNPDSDMYDGAAQAYVATFDMAAGATLAVELSNFGDAEAAEESYGQVFANVANIDGTLALRANMGDGNGPVLFDDEYYLDNIIEADTLNGTFDEVSLGGTGVLIEAEAVYDNAENVDVRIIRTAFGELGAETGNQGEVGTAIEAAYDTDLEGPFADLAGEFFTLDEDEYYDALDQLSGAQYAGYLKMLRNSSLLMNGLVSDRVDCAVSIRGLDDCRSPERGMRTWALGGYGSGRIDADTNAPAAESEGWFAMVGADYGIGNVTIGVFGGYRDIDTRFDRYGGEMDAAGVQIGAHAAYDVGAFYARGIVSYSTLNGESSRILSIGSVTGDINGDLDTGILSLYGEAGARLPLGSSWLTPFLAIDHTSIEFGGFTEEGVPGANLTLGDQSDAQTSAITGLKWAGVFGGIVPEAKLAYRHDFGDTFGFNASFADAPAGSDFRIVGPETSRDSVLAGFSLASTLSERLTGRIGYLGSFNENMRDHSLFGTLTLKLGGGSR